MSILAQLATVGTNLHMVFPAAGGGASAVAHRSPSALTGTRQEVQEKTVYIYVTHQHFGEVCTWTSEAGVTDLFSSSSSAANIC